MPKSHVEGGWAGRQPPYCSTTGGPRALKPTLGGILRGGLVLLPGGYFMGLFAALTSTRPFVHGREEVLFEFLEALLGRELAGRVL